MKQEIETLEFEIKNASLTNNKMKTIRNLKISLRALQRVAPYAVTAGFVFGAFVFFGDIPFYPNDEWKIYSKTMTEFDNNGNIRKEQQYDNFKDDNGNTLDESGFYSRSVQTYSIKKISYEDIVEKFKVQNLKLEDIFGEPTLNIKETKNNITEELLEEDFIQAIVYNEDKNDYIVHKETVGENIGLSVLYVFIAGLSEIAPLFFRSKISSFDFSSCVQRIKRKYPLTDIEELTKKLEIKQDNYNRLTR